MLLAAQFDTGSYRDRDGRVFYGASGTVLRTLSPRALAQWEALTGTRFFPQAMAAAQVVRTDRCAATQAELDRLTAAAGRAPDASWAALLQHERIPFITYPYEWSFGMLQDAALLQLELLQAALAEDFTLKDGTSFNVQWVGSRPTFIDVVSFERLTAGQPWAGYRQFCQTALYPLLLQAYRNIDFHPLLRGQLDGITPAECARLLPWHQLFRPGVLTHVWLHSRLQENQAVRDAHLKTDLRRAGFHKSLIVSNVAGLQRLLGHLRWTSASNWSGYATQNSYSEDDSRRKANFVRDAAAAAPISLAWDLGCNIGAYSRILAEHAEYVIAMDADHPTVERLYQSLKAEGNSPAAARIVPLVANLADPSPGLGWRNTERQTLPARGRPDFVLCLALIHHLVIGAGIPLSDALRWLADLGARIVIEFVDRSDPMVHQMLRNRNDRCADYCQASFEHWLHDLFTVVKSEPLGSGTRTLYYLTPHT